MEASSIASNVESVIHLEDGQKIGTTQMGLFEQWKLPNIELTPVEVGLSSER